MKASVKKAVLQWVVKCVETVNATAAVCELKVEVKVAKWAASTIKTEAICAVSVDGTVLMPNVW